MTAKDLKILVIEDDDFQRRIIVSMLRTLGATEICEACDGKQALEALEAAGTPVDIALCDMNMPKMDGMEFIRHLGKMQSSVSILILSMLNRALLASIETMAKAYGINLLGVVEKPIPLARLESIMANFERPTVRKVVAAARNFSLEEILQGMRADQFEPYFQPKIDLKTGNLTGAEALVRWMHPECGVVSPCAFIDLLEQSDNIDELTFIMLEKSAAACRLFHDRGDVITVSVNLSLVSLDDTELAHKITTAVKQAGLEPHHMMLEITESAIMTDVAHALENLARLCMHGFMLSIDDYGTGYSTMQQLTRIAFSELKIDQSFVKDFADNEALRIVVESSIEMAHKLNVKSVAEGVETHHDLQMLKSVGCDTAQGYFIARPMSLCDFLEFCASHDALSMSAQTGILPVACADPGIIDASVLAKMVGTDPATLNKFLRRFVETSGLDLTAMEAALADKDAATLHSLAHRGRSAARIAGAMGYADLCGRLEQAAGQGELQSVRGILPQLNSLLVRIEAEIKRVC